MVSTMEPPHGDTHNFKHARAAVNGDLNGGPMPGSQETYSFATANGANGSLNGDHSKQFVEEVIQDVLDQLVEEVAEPKHKLDSHHSDIPPGKPAQGDNAMLEPENQPIDALLETTGTGEADTAATGVTAAADLAATNAPSVPETSTEVPSEASQAQGPMGSTGVTQGVGEGLPAASQAAAQSTPLTEPAGSSPAAPKGLGGKAGLAPRGKPQGLGAMLPARSDATAATPPSTEAAAEQPKGLGAALKLPTKKAAAVSPAAAEKKPVVVQAAAKPAAKAAAAAVSQSAVAAVPQPAPAPPPVPEDMELKKMLAAFQASVAKRPGTRLKILQEVVTEQAQLLHSWQAYYRRQRALLLGSCPELLAITQLVQLLRSNPDLSTGDASPLDIALLAERAADQQLAQLQVALSIVADQGSMTAAQLAAAWFQSVDANELLTELGSHVDRDMDDVLADLDRVVADMVRREQAAIMATVQSGDMTAAFQPVTYTRPRRRGLPSQLLGLLAGVVTAPVRVVFWAAGGGRREKVATVAVDIEKLAFRQYQARAKLLRLYIGRVKQELDRLRAVGSVDE